MYYARTLSTAEALFVSRAQQRIAVLGAQVAEQYQRDDVDEFSIQLIKELQYAVRTLQSTFLDWTEDEIQSMMDYYTVHGKLVTFGFRSMVFDPLCAIAGGYVWATVPQLNQEITERTDYDAYLLSLINQLTIDYIAGDVILQNQINAIIAGNAVLTAQITADIDLGGIRAGDVFAIGTPLEQIWQKALGFPAVISNFTFNSFVNFVQVGNNLVVASFSWDVQGTPTNLRLSDSDGQLVNQVVSGTGYVPGVALTYNLATNDEVTWTLTGDNIDPVTITVKWRYLSYYGKNATGDDTPVTVTEAMVLAGTSYLVETADDVTVTADTSNGQQGFIAVHKTQTGTLYTKWFVDNTNFSSIASDEFILSPVDLLVGGVTYSIYRWGYRSPLTENIKLHR